MDFQRKIFSWGTTVYLTLLDVICPFDMPDTTRSFIAIELPEKIISSISKIQEDLRAYGFKIRWVRPENIHLTLKFLGNIDQADTEKVGEAITESVKGFVPFSLAAKGMGAFPSLRRPRVIWIGVSGDHEQLAGLQKRLDKKLAAIGFPEEKRLFRGHLTLGRVKQSIDPDRFAEAMKMVGGFASDTFLADEIVLFKSELKPTGAVYSKLMRASLV